MSSETPPVSIVMAVFNGEQSVARAIQSIIGQTFTDWEFIIVDDGSTDRTLDAIQKFLEVDDRIRLVRNAENLGLAQSLNKGIREAKGSYIARVDADDRCLPNRLETQFEAMESDPSIDILGSGAYLVDLSGELRGPSILPKSPTDFHGLAFLRAIVIHPTVMIRRELFERIGLSSEDHLLAEDLELWIRALRASCQIRNLPVPLIEYDTNGYIRSWRTIFSRAKSMIQIDRLHNVRSGTAVAMLSTAILIGKKMKLIGSRSLS